MIFNLVNPNEFDLDFEWAFAEIKARGITFILIVLMYLLFAAFYFNRKKSANNTLDLSAEK